MTQVATTQDRQGQRIAVSGGGVTALAVLRELLIEDVQITVYAEAPAHKLRNLARQGRLKLVKRGIVIGDGIAEDRIIGANEDDLLDAHAEWIAVHDGATFSRAQDLTSAHFPAPVGTAAARPAMTQELA